MLLTRIVAPLLIVAASLTACSAKTTAANVTGSAPCPAVADLNLYKAGQLTVATDSPAYEPWFEHNDPTNGEGFESAVAFAVAKQMGFSSDQVKWVKASFNTTYRPGSKDYDFAIEQISITPARAKAVEFSDGYYDSNQAVITLKANTAEASTLAGLKTLKLGAQTATTSLSEITDVVKPTQQPLVFDTNNEAKQALVNHQVDGIVVDLPTAFYLTAAEIPGSAIAGQFPVTGQPEQFGMTLEKGNPLVTCINSALSTLKANGTLAAIQQKWLSDEVKVPVLK
jgi:polar amino acid transport system substrate-binding protein